ncbi:hypothetical protein TcasGA2_TC015863 [Tribolium castaneum]|uniref:Uncharacterized protein n=1 Tax=Tribolium castaneum TaxID=7070 RepID=D2A4E8_TRICA|nr:hypothetical protein TcasGA2_TC015863 [Tribolium castaneum]
MDQGGFRISVGKPRFLVCGGTPLWGVLLERPDDDFGLVLYGVDPPNLHEHWLTTVEAEVYHMEDYNIISHLGRKAMEVP